MQGIWTGLAGRVVSSHELNFFVELDGLPLDPPAATLGQLGADGWEGWPPDQLPALRGRYAAEPVWVPRPPDAASGDFHPHVARLVNGQRPDLMRRYHLSDQARRLLASADLFGEATPVAERTS